MVVPGALPEKVHVTMIEDEPDPALYHELPHNEPRLVLEPHSIVQLVAAPFGFTVPWAAPPEVVTLSAAVVVTVGALGSVVKLRIEPLLVPPPLVAETR